MNHSNLETSYERYLRSGLEPSVGQELSDALHEAGLRDEANALNIFLRDGHGSICRFKENPWQNKRAFIGTSPPSDATQGDLWFDITELNPMVLIQHPIGTSNPMKRWVSTHPVYVWQFRPFLRMADWRLATRYFMDAADLMTLERFEPMCSSEPVTKLYHEEAVAYAHWFGKSLCGQFILQAARDCLSLEEFSEIMPVGLRLWDGEEFSRSDFLRIANSLNYLDNEPDDEFEVRETMQDVPVPDGMLFGVWDRRHDIGLSTAVYCEFGLIKEVPRMGFDFVELIDAAPRH